MPLAIIPSRHTEVSSALQESFRKCAVAQDQGPLGFSVNLEGYVDLEPETCASPSAEQSFINERVITRGSYMGIPYFQPRVDWGVEWIHWMGMKVICIRKNDNDTHPPNEWLVCWSVVSKTTDNISMTGPMMLMCILNSFLVKDMLCVLMCRAICSTPWI